MIVTLGSIRGSPGVTSWALLLAEAWPVESSAQRVVLEADTAGGVLGARYGLGTDPGAVTLIASLRHSNGVLEVAEHGRQVAGGVYVVPGPESGEQARAVWQGTAAVIAGQLAADRRVWLVDAGRLDAGSPVLPLGSSSTLTIVLCGAATEDLVQVPSRVAWLQQRGSRVGVMVVGSSGHGDRDLAEFFGTGLVWSVRASDELRDVAGGVIAGESRARRSWVWRTALDVAGTVEALTAANDRLDSEVEVR